VKSTANFPRRFGSVLSVFWLLSQSGSEAAILIQDTFGNLNNNATLGGRTPTTSLVGSSWTTTSGVFYGNGSGGLNINYGNSRSVSIDLGANYFTINPGVYDLSLSISYPDVDNTVWIGFGFAASHNTNSSPASNGTQPWVIQRQNGDVDVFAGPENTNVLTNGGGQPIVTTTAEVSHTLSLRLDTTGAKWTLQFYLDGNLKDLGAVGTTTYEFNSTPNIRYLQLGVGGSAGGTGTAVIDDFTFSGPLPVPEPNLLSLTAIACSAGVFRRRLSANPNPTLRS
jgi:hypothetical protein